MGGSQWDYSHTHIFEPAAETFDGFAENEHFCMRLAEALGLATAASTVRYFADQPVIVVERYDRVRTSDGVIRIHQEDMCQALACHPQQKYQAKCRRSLQNAPPVVTSKCTTLDGVGLVHFGCWKQGIVEAAEPRF